MGEWVAILPLTPHGLRGVVKGVVNAAGVQRVVSLGPFQAPKGPLVRNPNQGGLGGLPPAGGYGGLPPKIFRNNSTYKS